MRYLGIAFLIALLLACGTPSAARLTPGPVSTAVSTLERATEPPVTLADTPTAEVLAALATDTPAATAEPVAIAPTIEPTAAAPAPTKVPVLGASPKGSDCPADHPVKGNIVDRGENKGDKIYHVPGGSSYAQTKPERCFVDIAEAKLAGFRAPKL